MPSAERISAPFVAVTSEEGIKIDRVCVEETNQYDEEAVRLDFTLPSSERNSLPLVAVTSGEDMNLQPMITDQQLPFQVTATNKHEANVQVDDEASAVTVSTVGET